MSRELIYSHIPKTDIQANGTVLDDNSLYFVLLFYTLCSWQQQDQLEREAAVSPFLKIPSLEHIKNPTGGKKNRKSNVRAFTEKCQQLIDDYYPNHLSDHQKELLSLRQLDYLPKFGISIVTYENTTLLKLHYSRGKNMFRELIYAHTSGNSEKKHIQELKERYEVLDALQVPLFQKKKQLAEIEEKRGKLDQSRWALLKNYRLRLLDHKLSVLKQESAELEQQLAVKLSMQDDIEAKTSHVKGGVFASGGNGLARLAQVAPVVLVKKNEGIATKEMVSKSLGKLNSVTTSSTMLTSYPFLFRKVALNLSYPTQQYPVVTLEEQIEMYKREAQVSKTVTRELYIYDQNPITGKPEILSAYRDGRTLYDLQTNLSIGLKQRLIILYLSLIGYKEKCLDHNFIHRDIKPDNLFMEREGNILIPSPCDYANAILCDPEATLKTGMVGTTIYLSREAKTGTYSRKTDIYAFGKIIYDFLSPGYFPVDGAVLTRAEKNTQDSLRDFANAIMMHDEPEQRPTLEAVLQKFAGYLSKHKINPATAHQQGMLFENQLPDKLESIAYIPTPQSLRL